MGKKNSLCSCSQLSVLLPSLLCGKKVPHSLQSLHFTQLLSDQANSGHTFLEVSRGLTFQELLILLSGFQKLFFKLTKENEEEQEMSVFSHF